MKAATISCLTILMNILNTALVVMAHQRLDLLIPDCFTKSFSGKMAAGKGAFGALLTPALAADESMGQKTAKLQRQANQEAQMMNNMAKQLLKVSRLTARLAAVSWDCYMMKLEMEIMTLMDAAQADYQRTTQDMTGEDRYKMGPQHIYVWDAAMVWLLQTLKAEGTSAEARAHIPTLETYSSAMAKMGPNELAQEVRECKVKKSEDLDWAQKMRDELYETMAGGTLTPCDSPADSGTEAEHTSLTWGGTSSNPIRPGFPPPPLPDFVDPRAKQPTEEQKKMEEKINCRDTLWCKPFCVCFLEKGEFNSCDRPQDEFEEEPDEPDDQAFMQEPTEIQQKDEFVKCSEKPQDEFVNSCDRPQDEFVSNKSLRQQTGIHECQPISKHALTVKYGLGFKVYEKVFGTFNTSSLTTMPLRQKKRPPQKFFESKLCVCGFCRSYCTR